MNSLNKSVMYILFSLFSHWLNKEPCKKALNYDSCRKCVERFP